MVLGLMKTLEGEARALDLAHGLEAVERHPDRGADDRRLREWAVDDALGAECPLQIVGHAENAAVHADVLAQDQHVGVALHLLEERLIERLDHVHFGHGVSAGSAAGRASAWRRAGAWTSRRDAPLPCSREPPSPRAGLGDRAAARRTRGRTSSTGSRAAWPRSGESPRQSRRRPAARAPLREGSASPDTRGSG